MSAIELHQISVDWVAVLGIALIVGPTLFSVWLKRVMGDGE